MLGRVREKQVELEIAKENRVETNPGRQIARGRARESQRISEIQEC